jgi:hypothetical protein
MLKIKVEEAVDKLSKTKMGIHYMIVYADFKTLRMFYSQYTKRQIEENHSVLINTFYDTVESVKKILYEDVHINVFKYEKEEALLIIDAFDTYFAQHPYREFNEKMVNHIKKTGKEGLSILNEIGPFPFKGMYKRIIDYELSLPSIFNFPLKLFCLFYLRDFDGFSFEQRQKLSEHHGMTIIVNG